MNALARSTTEIWPGSSPISAPHASPATSVVTPYTDAAVLTRLTQPLGPSDLAEYKPRERERLAHACISTLQSELVMAIEVAPGTSRVRRPRLLGEKLGKLDDVARGRAFRFRVV